MNRAHSGEPGGAESFPVRAGESNDLTRADRTGSASGLRIDVHVHLAGVGTGDSGCWTSPRLLRRPTFLGLRLLHRISRRQMETSVDQDWAALVSDLVASSELDMAVALGFDGVYDSAGRIDHERSQMVVPPSWVFEVCRRYPNLLPGPSINPYRSDALDLLEMAIEDGAALIKWLPIVQGFDPAGPRAAPFLRRLAASGIPLLVHAGSGEVTFRTIDDSVGDLDRLIPALEAGVTVVCAHAAAPIHHRREPNRMPMLRSLLERFPNLWVDDSGITNFSRFLHLPRLANDPLIRERTVHGSDFPVPPAALLYTHRLGPRRAFRLATERNPLQREIAIKRALGVPAATLTRASRLLANVNRWHVNRSGGAAPPHPAG